MTAKGAWLRVCVLLALTTCLAPVRGASEPPALERRAPFSTYVLGPDGLISTWNSGESQLGPLPVPLAELNGRRVNDLRISEDGLTMIALLAPSPEGSAGSRKREGNAMVISVPPAPLPPEVLGEIPLEGDGRRVEISRDSRRAYVLSIRTGGPKDAGQVRSWLHALDLNAKRVVSSAQLDRPPSAIALDPSGARLFLAYSGRIVSYTTEPLALSWHYRSPGGNRDLGFRPRTAILFAVRAAQVALFDPAAIATLKPEERQKRVDDATTVVSLPFHADSLLFSQDGLLAAAQGPGAELAFVDPAAASNPVTKVAVDPSLDARQEIRPLYFETGSGDLAVGIFPERRVVIVAAPSRPSPVPEPAAEAAPSSSEPPAPAPTSAPTPAPEAIPPEPVAVPTAAPTPSATPVNDSPFLFGRLTGALQVVRAIVLYGPGSIVREQARVPPEADGTFRIPLPPPGTYRLVPLGEGSRPLRSDPNFHTLEVTDQGREDLDFKILGIN